MNQLQIIPTTVENKPHALSSGELLENECRYTPGTVLYDIMRLPGPYGFRPNYGRGWVYEHANARVQVAESFIASDRFINFCKLLLHWSRPASKADIAKTMTLLIGSFVGKPSNPKVFGTMLCEDVAALNPSVLALDMVGRRVRRSTIFLPSISEVLSAVTKADYDVRKHAEVSTSAPTQVAETRALIEALRLELGETKPPLGAPRPSSDEL